MPVISYDWVGDTLVTIFVNGKEIVTGRGSDRPQALHDAWTTLRDRGHRHLAAEVAEAYQRLTGMQPERRTP